MANRDDHEHEGDDLYAGEIPGFVRVQSLPYRPAVFSFLIHGPGGPLACSIPLDGSLEERRTPRTP